MQRLILITIIGSMQIYVMQEGICFIAQFRPAIHPSQPQ